MTDDDSEYANRTHRAQMCYQLPKGARQILLVRHGSSVGQTVDTVQLGPLTISDPVLAPDGHQQAEALARQLADEPISHIFVTPLRRTHQTAAPLARIREIAPLEIEDLREIHLGEWEHSFYDQVAARNPLINQLFAEETWDIVPGAERTADFAERLRRGIARVIEHLEPGASAVAVSHAASIAYICHLATGSRPFAFMAPENASVTRLVVSADGQWKLRSFNDVSHLGYH